MPPRSAALYRDPVNGNLHSQDTVSGLTALKLQSVGRSDSLPLDAVEPRLELELSVADNLLAVANAEGASAKSALPRSIAGFDDSQDSCIPEECDDEALESDLFGSPEEVDPGEGLPGSAAGSSVAPLVAVKEEINSQPRKFRKTLRGKAVIDITHSE